MVPIDDRRSTIDIENKLFYLDGELILFVALGKERGDDEGQLAVMTFHAMSLAGSQFPDHFDLCLRISLAQLVVHGAIATNVEAFDGGTNNGREFFVDCRIMPFVSEAGYNFRYDCWLKLVHNSTEFLRLNKDREVTSLGQNRLRGLG